MTTPAQARAQARLDTPPWRWSAVMLAPHRLSFLMAALVMCVSALWWWQVMLGRSTGWFAGPAAVPGTFVHALVMSLGFIPLFFGGFLFTAGPKWLQMPEVRAAEILKPVLAVVAVRAITTALSGALVLILAVRWGLIQSLRIRLLAMLHLGFVWLGVALCLDSATTVLRLLATVWAVHAPALLLAAPVDHPPVNRVAQPAPCGRTG